MASFKQYLTLILSIALVFLTINTPLIDYLTYIIAFLIIVSVALMIKNNNKNIADTFGNSSSFIILIITGTLLIVFLTGGITSSLFFFTYFLLFSIPFIFKPPSVFVFVLGLLALFLPEALKNDVFSNMIKVGSFIFLSPLAYFFGNEFKKKEKLSEEIEEKTRDIIEKADEVITNEAENMSTQDVDKMDKIVEEAEELKEEVEK